MTNPLTTSCVLIVDDDEDDRWLINQAFAKVCPQLQRVFANNGEEAVDYIQASPMPLFVLTDLNMPRLNGLELVMRLRHHPYFQTIPIVICTTSTSELDRQRCYLAGVNAYVHKPVRLVDLTELVRCLVGLWA